MSHSGKIAVIVPCFNHGKYLGECLESLIMQTFSNWVCMIIDDGSTDNSGEIARIYTNKDSRISYKYQNNSGVAIARNNGIKNTKSEFILPLDSDDKLAPTYFEKTLSVFTENPSTDLVYSNSIFFGIIEAENHLPDYSYSLLLQKNPIPATALYRRKDFNKTSGYDINMKEGWEDWEFWISLLNKHSSIVKLNENLFYYRIRNESRNRSLTNEQMYCLRNYIYRKHINKYRKNSFKLDVLKYRIWMFKMEITRKNFIRKLFD